jgi:hydroxymethylglutaryl-CoA reductase (NADPH)
MTMHPTEEIISKKHWTQEGHENRITFLEDYTQTSLPYLAGKKTFTDLPSLKGNIEQYIGMTQIPTGVIGAIKLKGKDAEGDFFVPMATSEGALVASYHRGALACSKAGGVYAVVLHENVQRCPIFKFADLSTALAFIQWVESQKHLFSTIVAQHSRFAQLNNVKFTIEGNAVIITFDYYTGDAAGQNMVTVCTEAICQFIENQCPIAITARYIDGNFSGDKKIRGAAFALPRGKYVTAEVILPRNIVEQDLRTTPEKLVDFWHSSVVGAAQMASLGINAHFPNGLAAMFIACGQDAACVSEACMGIARADLTPTGDLYGSVTLPNLIVGTVGGGTALPTQQECLRIMGCEGTGKSRKFAAICAAVLLAGEFSIAAAISGGYFSKAHKLYGRKKG